MINARIGNGGHDNRIPRCFEILEMPEIPADGFYKWQPTGTAKQLYCEDRLIIRGSRQERCSTRPSFALRYTTE
jgi:hypothetical protein